MHSFDPVDAEKYGILEAILLANIRWWTAKNKANKKHFYDGKYWTYNSAKAYSELFPYASQQQIQRALKSLEQAKMIVIGNYNTNPYNHTKWYAINGFWDDYDSSNLINREVNTDQPSNTDINTDTIVRQGNPLFEQFWKAYPKKTNKAFARKVFDKLKVDQALLDKMLKAIAAQIKTTWKDKDPQYIPHPSTWLNGERWEDEVTSFGKPLTASERATNMALGRPADYRMLTPEEQAERAKRIAMK